MLSSIASISTVARLKCKVCENNLGNATHMVREMMFGSRQPFTYSECSQCGCLQLLEHPADAAEYYPKSYYSFADTPSPPRLGRWKRWRMRHRKNYAATGRGFIGQLLNRKRPRSLLETLRPLGLRTDSRIMDVGCGSGVLLEELSQAGFRSLYGIDPYNRADITRPSGVQIDRRSIFSTNFRAHTIMFHHSFEHLENPQETLVRCHELLDPPGWCLLRIPVADSYAWKFYGSDWVQLDAPRHCFIHTVKSIELLAEQTGFRVEHVSYDSNEFQFWGSEQYRLGIPLRDPRSYAEAPARSIFSTSQIEAFREHSVELNRSHLGDQAAFYLSRKS